MHLQFLRRTVLAAAFAVPTAAFAGERLPVIKVSSSSGFDRACVNYYRQGNDQDVLPEFASQFCTCMAAELEHLGTDALDFFGRTYSEDLTTFIHEYPEGDSWMQASFAADSQCKNADYGSNEPPPETEPNPPPSPFGDAIEAGSWGGIVRSGPGQEFSRVANLAEGEHVYLLELTNEMFNGYPWWQIAFHGERKGYMWGGILCGLDGTIVDGVYQSCTFH